MHKLDKLSDKPTVLVVDDDPAIRMLVDTSLGLEGFHVVQATNGAEGLDIFMRSIVDVVLLDVNMPLMNGFECCTEIRRLEHGKDVPIVLITGMDDHASIKQAFSVKVTDFITKPVNWPILGHKVKYLLNSSKVLRQLRRSEDKLTLSNSIAQLGSWELDIDARKREYSAAACKILNLKQSIFDFNEESFYQHVHPDDKERVQQHIHHLMVNPHSYSLNYRILVDNKAERVIQEQGELSLLADTANKIIYGTVQDVTARMTIEEQVKHLSFYDTLTNLPNREYFKKSAKIAFEKAKRNNSLVAILFIDLDNFKRVNDSLGHDIGDLLLQKVSDNLKSSIRSSDCLVSSTSPDITLSRIGGDEFTILFSNLQSLEQVKKLSDRVHQRLNNVITIKHQEIVISGSIGISVYPDDGKDLKSLLKLADLAMFHGKKNGRNSVHFYSDNMVGHTREELNLEANLRKALEQNEFILHYQPQVSTLSGEIIGIEALIRWEDPNEGLIPPLKFIPIAEKSNLIVQIGTWVIESACQQLVKWHQQGHNHLKVSVNVSAQQFTSGDLVAVIERALTDSGLPAKCLELEITESLMISQDATLQSTLAQLKRIGVTIAIDDFGTGYSSINYLKKYPIDTLKIDKSFIDDIASNRRDAAITKAILDLAGNLDLTTIAEGVEMEEQLSMLRVQGCDQIQGYLFSKPLSVKEINQYLRDKSNLLNQDVCLSSATI